ncbi:MAG: flagellar type III secretion system protein FliR [Peptococcaceae bacterium]|nr:flagellar type III secretion system protein FliR [Peptococcaceae bacterium]
MLDPAQITIFFLVFLRAAAFLIAGPLYAFRGIPPMVKVGFALALAAVIFPVLEAGPPPAGIWEYGLAAVEEIGVGLLLGTAVTMILNGVRMAGQFVDFQIGYAMATLMDPLNGVQNTLLSQYLYLLGMVFFLVTDGHYTLITGLVQSYRLVPLGAASFGGSAALALLKIYAGAFTIALQVSAPVLAVLVVTDLALGFLARTAPQINVFLTGFPIKIAVGLLTLSFLLPLLGGVFRWIFNSIERDLYLLMRVLV